MNQLGDPQESVDFPIARLHQKTQWTASLGVLCLINNILSEEDLQGIEGCTTKEDQVFRFYECLEITREKITLLIKTLRDHTVRLDEAANIWQEFLDASPPELQSNNSPSNSITASRRNSTLPDATPTFPLEVGSERTFLSGQSSSRSSSPLPTPISQEQGTTTEESKLPYEIEANVQKVISYREAGGDRYPPPPEEEPVGHALFINIDKFCDPEKLREGAQGDTANLGKVLQDLGFIVETLPANEATFQGIDDCIESFKLKCANEHSHSCIVAVMSHGNTKNRATRNTIDVLTYDMKNKSTDSIVDKFNNKNFPALQGMPKVFFFQFCRGKAIDEGQSPPPAKTDSSSSPNTSQNLNGPQIQETFNRIPSWTDILICYPSMRGHYSYRDHKVGSYFIQTIAAVIKAKAHECHICEMMDIVAESMKLFSIPSEYEGKEMEVKQMCPYENIGFNKKFFLSRQAAERAILGITFPQSTGANYC